MAEEVDFKASLDVQNALVHRFKLQNPNSFNQLQDKLKELFEEVKNAPSFAVFWKDSDSDNVVINNDETLSTAVKEKNGQFVRIYIALAAVAVRFNAFVTWISIHCLSFRHLFHLQRKY